MDSYGSFRLELTPHTLGTAGRRVRFEVRVYYYYYYYYLLLLFIIYLFIIQKRGKQQY